MDAEHEIDPTIDPNKLIVQEGEDKGRVNAFETEQGTALTDDGEIKPGVEASEQPYTVEGLPVIGAEAEDKMRDNLAEANSRPPVGALADPFSEALRDMGGDKDKAVEAMADKAGTEAMAAEVSRRASELAKKQFPFASQELVDQFGQKAADKFKSELESENAEKKAQDDQGVQGLMDSLDSPDKKLSEVVPDAPKPESQLESDDDKLGRIGRSIGQGG